TAISLGYPPKPFPMTGVQKKILGEGGPSSPEFGGSSGIKWFQSPPKCNCVDRTVVLPTKFSTNHH
ncbi:hypothetical protein L195_g023922, partial [Trifolium pratense]